MAGAPLLRAVVATLILTLLRGAQASSAPLPSAHSARPVPVAADFCKGQKVSTTHYPLGKCTHSSFSGTKIATSRVCNSTVFETVSCFNSSECGKGYCMPVPSPVGQCTKMPGQRGATTLITCNSSTATVEFWSIQPPAPTGLACKDPSAAGSQLLVSAQVDPALVDEVSFEISLPFHPLFLTVTSQADKSGYAEAPISGLVTGTRYKVMVRSHRVGEQEGNPDVWSNVSKQSVHCRAKAPGTHDMAAGQGAGVDVHGVKTRWMEVYRSVGGSLAGQKPTPGLTMLPDFLDQHNTGDLVGALTMLHLYMQKDAHVPFTRYCVEMQDVSLPDVITGSPDGKARSSPFANFVSCNQGECHCMHQADRMIGRLPREQLEMFCNHTPQDWMMNTCQCPAAMMEVSHKYVGRSPIPLPFTIIQANVSSLPSVYPTPFKASPMGSFHSFPGGGRCALGKKVGEDGCTWQRSPTAWTVYTQDLLRKGYNVSASTTKLMPWGILMDYDATMNNLEVARKAFEALRPPPCGPNSQEDERLTLWV